MDNIIEQALAQIVTDVNNNDLSAIEELLSMVPEQLLKGYIQEDPTYESQL